MDASENTSNPKSLSMGWHSAAVVVVVVAVAVAVVASVGVAAVSAVLAVLPVPMHGVEDEHLSPVELIPWQQAPRDDVTRLPYLCVSAIPAVSIVLLFFVLPG